ncbi:MAG: hypothetical protein M3033_04690 [Acidobacteriota bacterium]|nr:hypothetical protein [Acidobacteriota bacterium]
MYCPRCSQEQISEETSFCSRCGFPLGLVAEIIAYGGFLPQLAELGKKRKIFTRRNGLLLALFWFMFFGLILAPLGSITRAPEAFSAFMALLGTMGCLFLIVISFAFLKKEPKAFDVPIQNTETAAGNIKNLYQKNQTALPPQQSIPVSTYVPPAQANWRDTNDLVPSVTEGTTKLLKEDEE